MPTPIKYVKSGSTNTPIENSRRELERILLRYGCRRILIEREFDEDQDETGVEIRFELYDHENEMAVPVMFKVNYAAIARILYGLPEGEGIPTGHWKQAQRVAWRNLVLWVDAALAAAQTGIKPLSECFLADIQVPGPSGPVRLADSLRDQLPGGIAGLLTAQGVAE